MSTAAKSTSSSSGSSRRRPTAFSESPAPNVDSHSEPLSTSTGSWAPWVEHSSGAVAVRGRTSATASKKASTDAIGSRTRIGVAPSITRACASGGKASARARRRSESAASSGPSCHMSRPEGEIDGRIRPRATRSTARRAATDQARTDGDTSWSGARSTSASSARSTGTALDPTDRRRTVDPAGRASTTSVSPSFEPLRHSARYERRAGSRGTKVASRSGVNMVDDATAARATRPAGGAPSCFRSAAVVLTGAVVGVEMGGPFFGVPGAKFTAGKER